MDSPKDGLLLAIGIKKKPDIPQPPQSLRRFLGGSEGAPQNPPAEPQPQGTKATRDEAGFIPAGQCCGDCEHFTKETGDCQKVEGTMTAHDSCKNYFESARGEQMNGASSDSGMPGV